MRILIINPNSDPEMTKKIQSTADAYSEGKFDTVAKSTPGAPEFIETYEDEHKAAPGMIRLVRENLNEFDGFIVACHDDPNLDVLKEITNKPVIGIGEASMKMASMLGHRFSVVSPTKHSIPIKQALVRKYHLEGVLASVRSPGAEDSEYSDEVKYLKMAKLAIEEDNAEVIVLGCAGLTGLDKILDKHLGAPVLDGVVCALIITSGLIKYGVSTSKIRKFNPNWK